MPYLAPCYNHNLHGKVISYNQILSHIPKRNKFLDNLTIQENDAIIEKGDPILFLPTYLHETKLQDEKYKKAVYKIILMGILTDGRKINVILDDIKPYFEVRIPHINDLIDYKLIYNTNYTTDKFIEELRNLLDKDEKTRPVKITKIKAKPFKYYRGCNSEYIRFYYKRNDDRIVAIKLVQNSCQKYNKIDNNESYIYINYETTTDDLSCYYRVVCRDHLTTFSKWVTLSNYTYEKHDILKGNTIRLSINDYKIYEGAKNTNISQDKTLSLCWDVETWVETYDETEKDIIPKPEDEKSVLFCLSMTFQWINDTDPFLKIAFCNLPANSNPDHLTVICGSQKNIIKGFADVFNLFKPEYIIGFNDSFYDWRWLVIRASQIKGVLPYLAEKLNNIKPYHQYTVDGILKFNFKNEKIKVEASNYAKAEILMMVGYIPIDVRIIFMKLYATAEDSKMNSFLKANNLPSKDDMPIPVLRRIYREFKKLSESKYIKFDTNGNDIDFEFKTDTPLNLIDQYIKLKEEFNLINQYCVVDSQRCHDLIKHRSVIMEHREISHLSYTSIYDAFYRANGCKVRNLTIAIGQDKNKFNIRFGNVSKKSGSSDKKNKNNEKKFPGGYVKLPEKGLQVSKLTIKERIQKAKETNKTDFPYNKEWLNVNVESEEVKNIYNIINEYGAILTDKQIDEIEIKQGFQIKDIYREFLTEKIGRPITGLDFSSLYPSLIRCYNFSPEYLILDDDINDLVKQNGYKTIELSFPFKEKMHKGYILQHENNIVYSKEITKNENGEEIKTTLINPNFKFGIYPYILDDLFNRRSVLKKEMKKLEHQKEELELNGEKNTNKYSDICFELNCINSKQNALKVFMNTFYGECGNQISAFFIVEIAGGITTYGVKNIKKAGEIVTAHQYKIYYGDTDSLYIACPETNFIEVDKLYYTDRKSKLDYWTDLVQISFRESDVIKNIVNNEFERENMNRYLAMAYEEVLYPVAFLAKKKYLGIPHVQNVNFDNDIFIRGLEFKKRGVSMFVKYIYKELMNTIFDINNLYTLKELGINKIVDIYNRKWNTKDFIQTDVYREEKQNVKVISFVKRMKNEGITISPNERFTYVVVKKYPYYYDQRGRKQELKIGDKMELFNEDSKDLEIDFDHYVKNGICGQIARLITYCPEFQVGINNALDEDEVKKAEDKTFKNAKKFITEFASQYFKSYNTFGNVFQTIYKNTNKIVNSKLNELDPVLLDIVSSMDINELENINDLSNWLIKLTYIKAKEMNKFHENYGENYIQNQLKKLNKKEKDIKLESIKKAYMDEKSNNILKIRNKLYKKKMIDITFNIRENTDKIKQLYNNCHSMVNDILNDIKGMVKIDPSLLKANNNKKAYKYNELNIQISETDILNKTNEYTKKIFNDKYKEIIKELKRIYHELININIIKLRNESIANYFKKMKNKKNRYIERPDDNEMNIIKNEQVNQIIENLDFDI